MSNRLIISRLEVKDTDTGMRSKAILMTDAFDACYTDMVEEIPASDLDLLKMLTASDDEGVRAMLLFHADKGMLIGKEWYDVSAIKAAVGVLLRECWQEDGRERFLQSGRPQP